MMSQFGNFALNLTFNYLWYINKIRLNQRTISPIFLWVKSNIYFNRYIRLQRLSASLIRYKSTSKPRETVLPGLWVWINLLLIYCKMFSESDVIVVNHVYPPFVQSLQMKIQIFYVSLTLIWNPYFHQNVRDRWDVR